MESPIKSEYKSKGVTTTHMEARNAGCNGTPIFERRSLESLKNRW